MDPIRFDTLIRGLHGRSGTRRRALALAGAALAAAVAPSPEGAGAITKRRCRKRGGVFLTHGECHCGENCLSTAQFTCHGNSNCTCRETAERRGFCSGETGNTGDGCSSSAACPSGLKCVVIRGCGGFGGESCTVATVGTDCPGGAGCIGGQCWPTVCMDPCPT